MHKGGQFIHSSELTSNRKRTPVRTVTGIPMKYVREEVEEIAQSRSETPPSPKLSDQACNLSLGR